MFGTFEAEKRDEKIAYGLVHPIETFDALYIQVIATLTSILDRSVRVFIFYQGVCLLGHIQASTESRVDLARSERHV